MPTPRFPLTSVCTAEVLGVLGWTSSPSGTWSLGLESKPGPWQLLWVKSVVWDVLNAGAGALP